MCALCWGGALEHGIMLKNGGEISPGVVAKCVKKYRTASAQHNHTTTQPQHTTTNMSRCRPTLQRLWPSPSMGRAAAPLNHGAAAPQHHAQAASRRACVRCCWFARLGRRNAIHRKTERGVGTYLGWLPFGWETQQSTESWRQR